MAALVPVTDKQIVFLHDLDDACFTQDGDLVFTKKSNAVDNGDGTATLTNPDGTTVTVSTGVGGTDTDTTYVLSLPNGVDGDGDIVFRLTDSNGVVNNITIPEAEINTDTIIGQPTLDQTTGILTIPLTDVNGTALPAKTVDLSVLMDNVDTDTIPTALAFDDATSTITLSRTDIAGTALADLTATLPVATALPCEVTVSTGFATDLWVNDFINRGGTVQQRCSN